MQWGKVKTVLIILLILINILLFIELNRLNYEHNYISVKFASDSISVLDSRGINIASETLPRKKPGIPIIRYNLLSANLEHNDEFNIDPERELLTFNENNEFVYENMIPFENAKNNPEAAVKRFFRKFKMNEDSYRIIYISEDRSHVTAVQVIHNTPVLGNISMEIKGESVVTASGSILFLKDYSEKKQELKDSVNCLFDIINSGEINSMDSKNIVKMELIYQPVVNTGFKNASLIPGYLIKTDTGSEYIYDLTTSRLFKYN